MIFPPLKNKVYDKFILEMMPGDPERLSSAIRGASRAYSKKEFYTLIAHGWYGGGLWDDLYFKRLRNAMNYAYIAGFKAIFSESGHFGFNGYGNKVERSDAEAARFRKEMSDFLQFCETDRRPLGGPDTPVAFLRGNLDGFMKCFFSGWIMETPENVFYGEPLSCRVSCSASTGRRVRGNVMLNAVLRRLRSWTAFRNGGAGESFPCRGSGGRASASHR